MRGVRRWLGWVLAAGLWALAVAIKLPVLHSPPYWDEGLHYWTAKHLGRGFEVMTDLWGNPVGTPQYLFFQRPAFYLAFWLPAQEGFQAFRTAHALAASALAPLAYALLRSHGAGRPAATLAGLGVAVVPSLAMWGNLGLMDSLMTACLGAALWARAHGRNGWLAVACVAAVWTKETAYAAVLALLAFEGLRGWIRGTVSVAPLRLDARVSALAWAAAIAPWPLMWALAHDLALPGAVNHGSSLPVIDRMFGTLWLLPVLALGLLRPRSRFLCAFALASGAFLLALQLAARDVPQWYEVPATFFALVGAAAAGDAWLRSGRPSLTRPLPAVVAVVLVYLLVMVPNSPERDLLRPLSRDGGNSLSGSWDFENRIRDGDLHAAIAHIPLDARPVVFGVDLAAAALFGPVTDQASHVYWDASLFRMYWEFDVHIGARRIEANDTWTLIDRSDLPYGSAIVEVYQDCIAYENAGFVVIQGTPCVGRGQALEDAWRARDPRF